MDWDFKYLESARNGDLEMVKDALANGANVNSKSRLTQYSAFTLAALNGHLEVVKHLLDSYDNIDVSGNSTTTGNAFYHIVQLGDYALSKKLIEKGVDVNIDFPAAAVRNFTCFKDSADFRELFFKHGGNEIRKELVKLAIGMGNVAELEKMRSSGFNMKTKSDSIYHLCLALESNQYEVSKWLIEDVGLDVNVMNVGGRTVLYTVDLDNVNQQTINIIEYFIQQGLNVNHQDIYGDTPLMVCAAIGSYDVVHCLLRAGARTDIVNKKGKDVFTYLGKDEEMKLFIRKMDHVVAAEMGLDSLEDSRARRIKL